MSPRKTPKKEVRKRKKLTGPRSRRASRRGVKSLGGEPVRFPRELSRAKRAFKKPDAGPSVGRVIGLKSQPKNPRKSPPWSKIKDPVERAHWKAHAAAFAEEQARAHAEDEIKRIGDAEAYRISKFHKGIIGRGARLLSAVVGRDIFEAAEGRFGGDLMARAARKIEEARKESEKKRKAGLAKLKVALTKKGFSLADVERFKSQVRPRVRVRKVHYEKVYGGRYKGQWKKFVHTPKGPKLVKFIKTASGLGNAKRYDLFRKRAGEIANHLGLTFQQARGVVKDVELQAMKDLRALKRTKGFKDLPPRKKSAYTERRWKAGGIAVLYALADIEGYT